MQWSKGRHSRCLYRTNHVEQAKQVCDFYKLCTVKARVELQNAERPHGKLLQSCSMTFNKGDYTFNFSQYITIPHTVTSRRRSRLPLTEKDPHTFLWWKLLRSDKLIPHRITQTIHVIHHRITSGTFIKLHVIRRKFNLFSSDAQTHLCPFDDLKNMEHCYRVSQGVEK